MTALVLTHLGQFMHLHFRCYVKVHVDILNYCKVPHSIFIQHVVVTRLQLPDF